MLNGNLKLAIQKKGRLTEKSIELLKSCSFDVENYKDRLLVSTRNFELDVLFLRDDDIPEYVQDNVADLGIVGQNVVYEKGADVEEIKKLGFGKCNLIIGIPEDQELKSLKELNGKRIATSYPKILKNFLDKHKIDAKIIQISGSVEIAPNLGISDYICDIVSTGNTLKLNKLKKSFSVFDSQSVLIANKTLKENIEKKSLLNDLLQRINSVLVARKSKYIMMNVPSEKIENIVRIIPALKSPTILPLADDRMVAVHALIPEEKFWNIADDLKTAGASGILLLPVENMIA